MKAGENLLAAAAKIAKISTTCWLTLRRAAPPAGDGSEKPAKTPSLTLASAQQHIARKKKKKKACRQRRRHGTSGNNGVINNISIFWLI